MGGISLREPEQKRAGCPLQEVKTASSFFRHACPESYAGNAFASSSPTSACDLSCALWYAIYFYKLAGISFPYFKPLGQPSSEAGSQLRLSELRRAWPCQDSGVLRQVLETYAWASPRTQDPGNSRSETSQETSDRCCRCSPHNGAASSEC